MAAPSELSKCSCCACGVHLEFPLEMLGSTISCPSCNSHTILEGPEMRPRDGNEALPIATLLSAFQGEVRGQRASLLYQVGLMLVASAILILPILYLALIASAGYGVYWWATEFTFLLTGRNYGIYFMLMKILLYLTPLLTGLIVVFFMIKPLLAKRAPSAQPLALNPANEPLLFSFITEICRTIGAPIPSRIDVDCHLNASAGFRRGFKSFFGDDLVLTIGLPLVAGTNLTQLGGIIAHEFGHFTQSFAMRLNYIIRRVNQWFVRVIYERDQWDLMLAESAAEVEEWWMQLVLGIASLGVWFSRLLLRPLMWIGIGISAFVSRQMEYNADAYEIDFVGSEIFEDTTVRFAALGSSLETAYKEMRVRWHHSRALPENFPQFVVLHDAKMPEAKRAAILDRVGLEQSSWFSTHPASGDRIRCARRAQKPGVFSLDVPAKALFSNFDVIAQQVSVLHYTEDLGLPRAMIQLRSAESFFETVRPSEHEIPNLDREKMEKTFGPARLKLKAIP